MASASKIRSEITELENEESRLQDEDKAFWKYPQHHAEASTAYQRRKERTISIRKELAVLYRDLHLAREP